MFFFSKKSFNLLLILLVSLFLLVSIKKAYVQPPPPTIPTYTWSAHGNTSYGVLRASLSTPPNDYGRGNCAHCHEQHASVGGSEPEPNAADDMGPDSYLLYKMLWGTGSPPGNPQLYEFCYGCHRGSGSCQSGTGTCQSSWGRTPDFALYSYRAGGDTSITCLGAPYSVYDSFQFVNNSNGNSRNNCGSTIGSSHMLKNIRNYLTGKWNFATITDYVNPCSGCHNPHRAQRDPHTPAGRFVGQKLLGVVSLPSDHSKDNNAWKLWGDDPGERMSDYTALYQAPYRYNSTTTYEPDGSATTNGSNLFNTVTFCLVCHGSSPAPYSQRLNRDLNIIDWGPTGDIHGQCNQGDNPNPGSPISPYVASNHYVLSCLDCHEPHGSRNEFLLRQEVNGMQIPVITSSGHWCDFCKACHGYVHYTDCNIAPSCYSGGCHQHGLNSGGCSTTTGKGL